MIRLVPKKPKETFTSTKFVDIDELYKQIYSGPVIKIKNGNKLKTPK